MKVFFYSHTLCPGGAEKQCALIAAEIKKRYGYESTVILNNGKGIKPEYAQYLRDANVPIVVLPQGRISRCLALFKLFHAHRNAILFNYLTGPDCWGALMARLAELKRIVGGIETDKLFGVKFISEKIVHTHFAVRTICNSCTAYDYFSEHGFEKKRLVIMPSAMSMMREDEIPTRNNSHAAKILCVGRFCIEKDYATWVDVIAKVHSQRPDVRATIIGYGELEAAIRTKIKETGLEDVITILPGQCTNIKEELKRHDIYLSTSIQEGVSNSILEAMDAALPAVVTDVGDNAQMVKDGKSGFVCRVKDVEGLSERVLKLVDNPAMRRDFGAQAREILKAKYSLEKIAADYRNLIEELK